VAGAGGMRRLDAGAALGPAAATKATTLAIELAREHGMALVALGNSGRPEDAPLAEPYAQGDDELLREHAEWALRRLAERPET